MCVNLVPGVSCPAPSLRTGGIGEGGTSGRAPSAQSRFFFKLKQFGDCYQFPEPRPTLSWLSCGST